MIAPVVDLNAAVPPLPAWPQGDGSIADFLAKPAPPQEWLFSHQIPLGRAVLLSGIGGSSKTRALIHMGFGAACGRLTWDWTVPKAGAAVLLLTEDTREDAHRAVRAIADHSNLTAEELAAVASRLHVFALAGEDSRLLMLMPGGELEPCGRFAQLLDKLRCIDDLLVIGLDPAIALSDGNELDATHQRRLGELADRLAIETGATVILTSHAAKHIQQADELGSHTSRGSGALTDACRAEYILRTMTPAEGRQFGITKPEERRAYVQLVATKGNALAPAAFKPLWLHRTYGGVLVPADLEAGSGSVSAIGQREQDAYELLCQIAKKTTPTMGDWRDRCAAAGLLTGSDGSDARRKSMTRLRDALLAAGMIERGEARDAIVPL